MRNSSLTSALLWKSSSLHRCGIRIASSRAGNCVSEEPRFYHLPCTVSSVVISSSKPDSQILARSGQEYQQSGRCYRAILIPELWSWAYCLSTLRRKLYSRLHCPIEINFAPSMLIDQWPTHRLYRARIQSSRNISQIGERSADRYTRL